MITEEAAQRNDNELTEFHAIAAAGPIVREIRVIRGHGA
jgi:hypothetical protein